MCASEVDKFSRNDYRSTFFLTFSIDTGVLELAYEWGGKIKGGGAKDMNFK